MMCEICKMEGKKSPGRLRSRCDDAIKSFVKNGCGVVEWVELALDRLQCQIESSVSIRHRICCLSKHM